MLWTNGPAQNPKAFPDVHFFQTSLPLPSLLSRNGENWLRAVSLYAVEDHDALSTCFIILVLPELGSQQKIHWPN